MLWDSRDRKPGVKAGTNTKTEQAHCHPSPPEMFLLNGFASCSWSRCTSHAVHIYPLPVPRVRYLTRCMLKIYRPPVWAKGQDMAHEALFYMGLPVF